MFDIQYKQVISPLKLRSCYFISFQMEDRSLSPTPDRTPPDHTSNTPVVTIFADSPHDHSNDDDIILPPESKKVRLTSPVPAPILTKAPPIIDSAGIMAAAAAAAAVTASSGNSQSLSNHEVQAVRQLISGESPFLEKMCDIVVKVFVNVVVCMYMCLVMQDTPSNHQYCLHSLPWASLPITFHSWPHYPSSPHPILVPHSPPPSHSSPPFPLPPFPPPPIPF